jgi:hypothetical protein
MFKWTCLAVATLFLGAVAWMLNDVRLEVKRTSQTVNTAGEALNADLPDILAKTRRAADALGEDVPEIIDKSRNITDQVAEMTADVRTLKEALAKMKVERDPELLRYAGDLLDTVAAAPKATVGVKPITGIGGLRDPVPAREWVVKARKEANLLTLLTSSKAELASKLTSTALGSPYLLKFPGKKAVPLLDWLKENHQETKLLFALD